MSVAVTHGDSGMEAIIVLSLSGVVCHTIGMVDLGSYGLISGDHIVGGGLTIAVTMAEDIIMMTVI